MKIFLFFISFLIALTVEGKPKEEKYFINTGGSRIDFKRIIRISDDSVFYAVDSASSSFILIDSVAEYHYYKKGNALKGFIIGASCGLVIGSAVGAATFENPSGSWVVIEQSDAIAAGAIAGFLGGGLVGTIIGATSNHKVNFIFKQYGKDTKKQILLNLES